MPEVSGMESLDAKRNIVPPNMTLDAANGVDADLMAKVGKKVQDLGLNEGM